MFLVGDSCRIERSSCIICGLELCKRGDETVFVVEMTWESVKAEVIRGTLQYGATIAYTGLTASSHCRDFELLIKLIFCNEPFETDCALVLHGSRQMSTF